MVQLLIFLNSFPKHPSPRFYMLWRLTSWPSVQFCMPGQRREVAVRWRDTWRRCAWAHSLCRVILPDHCKDQLQGGGTQCKGQAGLWGHHCKITDCCFKFFVTLHFSYCEIRTSLWDIRLTGLWSQHDQTRLSQSPPKYVEDFCFSLTSMTHTCYMF